MHVSKTGASVTTAKKKHLKLNEKMKQVWLTKLTIHGILFIWVLTSLSTLYRSYQDG